MARTTVFSALVAAGLLSFAVDADAQQLRYSTTAPGGIASTGNTLGLAKAEDQNGPGTEDSIGTFISLDPQLIDDAPANVNNPWSSGTTWDWTQNGSAAALSLPVGAQVLHAELVWAGSHDYWPETVTEWIDLPVALLAGTDEIAVAPDPATAQTLEEQSYTGFWANYYLRSADVTSFVQQHGATMYAVAGVPATQGTLIDSLNAAGWSLVVAYRHDASPIRNLSVFVGGTFVDEDSSVDYTVTGFCAPPFGEVEGKATVAALEGDADLTGEDFGIGETSQGSFVSLSGPNNPQNNFFCSQLNDNDGLLDKTGSFGDHNHDAAMGENLPGARQGWDHTTVALSSTAGQVSNNQTSAVLRTTTVGDSYFPVLVALELDVKAPDFSDSLTQASLQTAKIGDQFTVTTTLANSGEAQATDLSFAMPLDAGLSLVSFSIDGVAGDAHGNPVSQADLDSGIDAGILHVGEMRTVELLVEVASEPQGGNEYVFAPDWGHSFTSCSSDPAIDESFAGPTVAVQYDYDDGEPNDPPVEDPPVEEPPADNGDDYTDPIQEGDCGCKVPGSGTAPNGMGALSLLALGAAMALRRRRS
ncbi:MAG: hypothetical protein DRI90_07915 [Deltaproteobacteria bacterium]|nr:MAG: hypothetical protein DRI90_07915 [Deltaproteobacteria bacterium]